MYFVGDKEINTVNSEGKRSWTLEGTKVFHSKRGSCEYSVGTAISGQASIHLQVGGYETGPMITMDRGMKKLLKLLSA